jgi:hypothetical protein
VTPPALAGGGCWVLQVRLQAAALRLLLLQRLGPASVQWTLLLHAPVRCRLLGWVCHGGHWAPQSAVQLHHCC